MKRTKSKLTHLSQMFKKGPLHENFGKGLAKFEIWNRWQHIMPEPIASQTAPVRWQGNFLIIGTPSSAWSQEMTYLKPELLKRLRQDLPSLKIDDLRFETGYAPTTKNKQADQTKKQKKPSKETCEKIESWTACLSSDELKAVVQKAMAKALEDERK